MTGSLGRRYARALLSLAREAGRLEEVGDEIANVAVAFADERLQSIVRNPAVGTTMRDRVAQRIAATLRLSPMVTNLVRLLAQRDRLGVIGDIERAYTTLLDRELGRTRVVIRSAMDLSADDRNRLTQLARELAGREVVVSSEVVPEMLGGAALDVGGVVYDGSIKTQLLRMAKSMSAGGH